MGEQRRIVVGTDRVQKQRDSGLVHAYAIPLPASGGGNSSLESARAWLRLREFKRRRAPLACDHRGPQQDLAGALLVGRDLPQLVEIASAQLGIARFEPVLVRYRLLLHELDRDRATLKIVEVEQTVRLTAEKNSRKLLGEIGRILDAAVEAHPADRIVHVRGVAREQRATLAEGCRHALVR